MVSIGIWTQEEQTQETNICTCSTQVICNLPRDSHQMNAFFSFLHLGFKLMHSTPTPMSLNNWTTAEGQRMPLCLKLPLFSLQKQRRGTRNLMSMFCWFSQFPSTVQQIVQTGFEHECISCCSLLYKCNPACRVQAFTLSPMMGFGFKALPCLQWRALQIVGVFLSIAKNLGHQAKLLYLPRQHHCSNQKLV